MAGDDVEDRHAYDAAEKKPFSMRMDCSHGYCIYPVLIRWTYSYVLSSKAYIYKHEIPDAAILLLAGARNAFPWLPAMAVILLMGIIAEVRRSAVSPIVNLTPPACWLLAILRERARVSGDATAQELFLGQVLFVFPLTVIVVLDVLLYISAFRRNTSGRNASPS